MQQFILFVIKSGLVAGSLFGYYLLFLKNSKMQQFNRFYLMGSVVISMVIPFLHFSLYSASAVLPGKVSTLIRIISSDEVEKIPVLKQSSSISFQSVAVIIYLSVSICLLALLVARVLWVYRLKKTGRVEPMNGFDLIHTNSSKAPFSFMKNLFWKEGIAADTETGQHIMKHELVHIRQQHTLDKMFMQIVLVICWINPFYWLMLKELSYVHEFIADEGAIEGGDMEAFAKMFLQSHYGSSYPRIINPFFYSSIKRRLIMLSKTNNTRYALLRRAMVLPLLGATVLLFSFSKKEIHKADRNILLVLDAGHGGNDNGVVGANGLPEKDMALRVSKKLTQLAGNYNIKVVQTREDDNYVTLENRAKMANDVNGDVFVSIHINSKEVQGYDVILGKRNAQYANSKLLAANVVTQLNAMNIRPNVEDKSLWVLNNSNMPAILIECGNIENRKDMAMINDNQQLERMCRSILNGVVAYTNRK